MEENLAMDGLKDHGTAGRGGKGNRAIVASDATPWSRRNGGESGGVCLLDAEWIWGMTWLVKVKRPIQSSGSAEMVCRGVRCQCMSITRQRAAGIEW